MVGGIFKIKGYKYSEMATQFPNQFSIFSDKGEVFGWGNNEYSQLEATNGDQQLCTPIHLNKLKQCGKIVDIACGGSSCIALNG